MKEAPREHLARWQQLVHPLWLADLQIGKPVVFAAPRGVEGVRGGLGIPKGPSAEPHPGAGLASTPNGWKGTAVEQGL